MAEVLARLTEDRQENAAVFDLLATSLRLLADGVDPFHVTRHYEMALLTLLGYRPELRRCIECRAPLRQEPHPFAAAMGGFLCETCRGQAPAGRAVSVSAQKYLRALDRGGLGATVRLALAPSLRDELEGLLHSYLRHIAERDLGSLRVLREMHAGPAYDAP
jgi:DNA repair protein RecO (recombination protein O)